MKKFALFGFLSLALASHAAAGLLVNINVDEFGNGSTDFPSTVLHALNAAVIADPTSGIAGKVLIYQLPFQTVQGDLHITEPGVGPAPAISDVLRFVNINSIGFLIFYSDLDDSVGAPADTGLPGNSSTNIVTIPEIGPEGNNGAIYTPVGGNPGYVSTDFSPVYNIISDSAVPEPGSVMLIVAGLGGLGLLKKFRK